MVTRSRARPTADEYLEQVKSSILAKYPDVRFEIVRRRRNEITVDAVGDFDIVGLAYIAAELTTNILVETGIHIVVVPVGRRENSN